MFWRRILGITTILLLVVLTVPAAAQSTRTVYVTTQRFDNGLMLWFADSGSIYVLGNNGQALHFTLSSYTNLPDNPIVGNPPSRLRPIFGFGKVWGNNASVRDLLGWPTLPEIGFSTTLMVQNATLFVNQLDNTTIQINSNGTWVLLNAAPPTTMPGCPQGLFWGQPVNEPPCPDAPTTAQAAYQRFENGFMIWLSGSGDVWVFINAHPGFMPLWSHFAESAYRGFQDAPAQTPPAGKYQPINAFGRIWNNLTDSEGRQLSQELGWATARESSYQATQQVFGVTNHIHRYLSLPDGRVVDAYRGLAGINWFLEK